MEASSVLEASSAKDESLIVSSHATVEWEEKMVEVALQEKDDDAESPLAGTNLSASWTGLGYSSDTPTTVDKPSSQWRPGNQINRTILDGRLFSHLNACGPR